MKPQPYAPLITAALLASLAGLPLSVAFGQEGSAPEGLSGQEGAAPEGTSGQEIIPDSVQEAPLVAESPATQEASGQQPNLNATQPEEGSAPDLSLEESSLEGPSLEGSSLDRDVNGDFGLDTPPATAVEGLFLAEERVVYDGSAIPITLSVGIERKVVFPGLVTLKLDPSIAPGKLKTTPLGDVVLWRPTEAFPRTRALAEDSQRGITYAIDLQALESEPRAGVPLRIELPSSQSADDGNRGRTEIPVHTIDPHRYSYRALTQFAAQQLYAPERLIEPVPGIGAAKVARDPVRLMRYGEVTAIPVASWQAPGVYVTAVKLINNLKRPLALDPRNLIGAWIAATFQYTRLEPHGNGADTGAVYLISKTPFVQAIGGSNVFTKPKHDANYDRRGDYPNEDRGDYTTLGN